MDGDASGRRAAAAVVALFPVAVGLAHAVLVHVAAVVVADDDGAVAGDAEAAGVVGDAGAVSLGLR